MACSDNVVRAGLTPKFIDVETLVDMLNYEFSSPGEKLFRGEEIPTSSPVLITEYDPPVDDFTVARYELPESSDTATVSLPVVDSASLVLFVKSEGVKVRTENGDRDVSPGSVLFLAAGQKVDLIKTGGSALLFRAYVNLWKTSFIELTFWEPQTAELSLAPHVGLYVLVKGTFAEFILWNRLKRILSLYCRFSDVKTIQIQSFKTGGMECVASWDTHKLQWTARDEMQCTGDDLATRVHNLVVLSPVYFWAICIIEVCLFPYSGLFVCLFLRVCVPLTSSLWFEFFMKFLYGAE